jgi:membrane protein
MGRSRREARWQWLSVGSVAAAIGWPIGSVLFSWYIAHFGAYNATYGSLRHRGQHDDVDVDLRHRHLLGGELNAEIEHQSKQGHFEVRSPAIGYLDELRS